MLGIACVPELRDGVRLCLRGRTRIGRDSQSVGNARRVIGIEHDIGDGRRLWLLEKI
ncbi:MAG: hypothetical protein IH600_01170 [Bacteroidetes bacterium]|nr:hypothetical protein [Bacteroidota bacterium]